MAADVVGYSRLMGEDEAGTLERLKSFRNDHFDPAVADHNGRVVKLIGDGTLVEFGSAVDAVTCAISLQGALAQQAEPERLMLRIGVNLGDVIVEGDDLYGDGVNIATRLEGVAEPGGVCVSQAVAEQTRGKVDATFTDLGHLTLKNIAKPTRVWAVSHKSAPSRREICRTLPEKPSIAVLPLDNMSGDPDQTYFGDGITEDIITELCRFSGLFVISRNSSFSYRGKTIDLRQVARELGVRYLLEGSIRRAGNRVRITAQLIEGAGGGHIWSERYDRELEDIFAVQDEITQNVVGAIAPQIELAEMENARRADPIKMSAYDLALRAQAMFYETAGRSDRARVTEVIDLADQALAIDPQSTHALLIKCITLSNYYLGATGDDAETMLEAAWEAISRLLQVNQDDACALAARAIVRHFRRDFDAARADFNRAIDLNPNHSWSVLSQAWHQSLTGETHAARENAHLALRLSPRDTDYWMGDAYLTLLQAHFAERDFEQAELFGLEAIRFGPRAPIRRALVAACQVYLGRRPEARATLDVLSGFAPDFVPRLLAGHLPLYKLPEHETLMTDALREACQGDA